MNFRLYIFVFIAYLSSASRSYAQYGFTVDSLISKAIQQDYSIKVLEKEVQRSSLEIKLTKSTRLPMISTNLWNGVTSGRYYDILSNQFTTARTLINSLGITANWNLFNGGYTTTKITLDQAQYAIHNLNLEKRKIEISKAVIELYGEILLSIKLAELFQKEIDLYKDEENRLNELRKLKKITYANAAIVTITKQKLENRKLELEYKLDLDIYNLGLLIDMVLPLEAIKPFDNINLVDINTLDFVFSTDTAWLRKSSIGYNIKQLEIKKADLNTALRGTDSKLKIKAGIGVYTGYSTNRSLYNMETNSVIRSPLMNQLGDNTYEALTLNFYLPIYDRHNRIVEKQSIIEQNIAELERDQIEKKIIFRYEMAKKDLWIKQKRLKVANSQWMNEKEIFKSYEERFAADRLLKTEFLAAQERIIEGEIDYYSSYYDFFKAFKIFEIEYLNGATY